MKFMTADQVAVKAILNQTYKINLLRDLIYQSNIKAGWYEDIETGEPIERNVGEMLALIHSEVSEALEGYRKDLMDDHLPERKMIEVELADTIIRILDLSGYLGLDIAGAIVDKWKYNQTRQDHKRENRVKDGGKKL